MGRNTVLIQIDSSCAEPPPAGQGNASLSKKTSAFVKTVLDELDIADWEISVLFCADSYMQLLNKQYRGKDEPTDVLSFNAGDSYIDENGKKIFAAGDIVISIDSLYKNCAEFHVTPDEELKRLLVHGILHLKGYDHEGTISGQAGDIVEDMLSLQEHILQNFKTSVIII